MSRVYLHCKKNKNSLINKLLIFLGIFLLFGFYKNGISLYLRNYVSLLGMLKPILLVVITILLSCLFSYISKEKVLGYRLLSNIIIALIVPPSINIILFLIVLLAVNVINKFWKINIVASFMVISLVALLLLKDYSFYNLFEISMEYKYSFLDYFLGKGYGGISNTLLILSVLTLIILSLDIEYKKQIPIWGFITYYTLIFITALVRAEFTTDLILNNNIIFAFIFICPISIYSPYSKGACYIYGILLGFLTYLFSFFEVNLGLYITILILSCLSPLLDKFIVGKNNNLVEVL